MKIAHLSIPEKYSSLSPHCKRVGCIGSLRDLCTIMRYQLPTHHAFSQKCLDITIFDCLGCRLRSKHAILDDLLSVCFLSLYLYVTVLVDQMVKHVCCCGRRVNMSKIFFVTVDFHIQPQLSTNKLCVYSYSLLIAYFFLLTGKVCDAVEVAGKNVMSTSSTITTELVSHR